MIGDYSEKVDKLLNFLVVIMLVMFVIIGIVLAAKVIFMIITIGF